MVQAIDNPIATNFLTDAVVERHNFSQLNKTRIRFRIQLKKSTKSAAPKWADVLKAEVSEIESDLVKVTNSEVGLRGIKVFKKLDEVPHNFVKKLLRFKSGCLLILAIGFVRLI